MLFHVLQGCGGSTSDEMTDPVTGIDDEQPVQDGEQVPGAGQLPADRPFEEPRPVGPAGDSGIRVGERFYPLDSAIGDIWGVEQNHFNVDFTLANGRYRLETIEIDGVVHTLLVPAAASAVVHAELYSPGQQFSLATYTYSSEGSDEASDALTGTAWFDQAWVGVDEDLSGDVEPDERRDVIDGTVIFSGTLPNIELHLNLLLETGQLVEGHYYGLFDFTER